MRNSGVGAGRAVSEAVFRGRFREQFNALTAIERAGVDRVVRLIELDPHVGGVHKVDVPVPPMILRAYGNGVWRIAYRVAGDRFVELYVITRI